MQVADKLQEEGEKLRKQAIVEVMVDLLLDIEGITEHEGLVYVPESSAEMAPLCKQLVLKAFRYQQELGGVHMVLRGLLKSPVPLMFSCRVIQLNGALSAAM